jgi:hypothetical protein
VPAPINRRREGKNRTTHLKATSYLSLLSSLSFLVGVVKTTSHQEYECEEDLAYVVLGREERVWVNRWDMR